ncbi:hypothetical protein FDECE_2736 [Fusarium decemcellulare]|nr:hypothetical protein FDECE_2736 [Fusarium decemcellulare]
MSTESTERKTINVPASSEQREERLLGLVDDRTKTALQELHEGELLQLTVDYAEHEAQFTNSYKEVAPESVGEYFASPSPQTFFFYRYPGSSAVVLIWTRYPLATSTKHTNAQNRVRWDLALVAEREGIEALHMLKITSQNDVTAESLREAVNSSPIQGTKSLE